MTFGKEGHWVGQYPPWQQAYSPPHRTRAEIVQQWLPTILGEVLATREIAAGVDEAGIDQGALVRRVLDEHEEAIAPANALLARAVDAAIHGSSNVVTPEVRSAWRPRVAVLTVSGLLVAGPVVPLVLFWLGLAWWAAFLVLLGTAIVMTFGGIVYLVSQNAYRRTRFRYTALSYPVALKMWQRACRDEGVLPYVRRVVDEHLAPRARLLLGVTAEDAPGLRGTGESSYMVRTSSVEAFRSAVNRLPTGAIGIAGPRGVGKTSIIEYFAGRPGSDDEAHRTLKVTLSAPVEYEPRDFVLHLFATVCQAVLRGRPATGRFLPWRRDEVGERARRHLENIHYLRTHTSGWSGKLTLPTKSEAGWSRQTQRERRPQTYPELVSALREFLATYTQSEEAVPALIVAIDELDKIGSADRAQQFLNEIKGTFEAPGTQFLVAISEDALAAFERRGLPVRDAFDSAFHEIVRVDYLTLSDTAGLLSSRVLRLPEPFKWLVHCMSGGLPRDVVRTARAMVALAGAPPPGLGDVCMALVSDDLRRKSHAFQLACRDIGDSPDLTEFMRSLRRLPGDAAMLLGLVRELRQEGELATLSRQAAAYVYYSATLLEVFTPDRVDSKDNETFDLLARAKQSLAVHPRLAWLQVDEFREAWGLPTVPVD